VFARSTATLTLVALVLAAVPLAAQSTGLPFEVGAATYAPDAPAIDGDLSDEAWSRTLPMTPFQTLTLHRPAEVQTTGYMLFDATRLYIGVRCDEPQPERLKATIDKRDGPTYYDDCIEIFLVPPDSPILMQFEERIRYFHLVVNPLGTRYDEIGMNSPNAFTAEWQAEAEIGDDYWSLEIAIPFAAFGVDVAAGDVWRGNISRSRTPKAAYTTWAPLVRSFHDTANFGQIVFTRDAAATAERIEALEFEALMNGMLRPRLLALEPVLEDLAEDAAQLPEVAREDAARMVRRLMGRQRNLQFGLAKLTGENFREQWPPFEGRLTRLERAADDAADEIAMLAATRGGREPWEIFITDAMTNRRLLSNRWPQGLKSHRRIEITATPGEYESATFAVYAVEELSGVDLEISDLRSGAETLPASVIEPWVVQCWYQAGRGIGDIGQLIPAPELLLKDDDLVRVDYEEQRNYVRAEAGSDRYLDVSTEESPHLANLRPEDAATLQPVNMPARRLKQWWLTAHVPEDAAPGTYSGTITVTADGGMTEELPVRLRVLPFTLDDSALEYSIYYRGKLTESGAGSISSEGKSEDQFLAEMRDMVAHGVTNPTIYQKLDETLLPRVFELREQAGMHEKRVYSLGIGTGAPKSEEELANLREGVQRWREFIEGRGYETLYVYGIDEAKGEELQAERNAFEAVHESGAKVFVACYKDWFDLVGDLLDLPVWSGQPLAEEAEKAHSVGGRIFNYGHPQCGVEEPETYRRNFGLLLWSVGYDGAMDYAYQHSFGHGWNDFDSTRYRDHNMTYQTVDGVIGTVQWEGFREGVDDVRYVSTLLNAIERTKLDPAKREVATRAETWLQAAAERVAAEETVDMTDLRRQVIVWIERLQ